MADDGLFDCSERYTCPICGASVIEECFCPVHKCCTQCDDECFPPGDDDDDADEWDGEW